MVLTEFVAGTVVPQCILLIQYYINHRIPISDKLLARYLQTGSEPRQVTRALPVPVGLLTSGILQLTNINCFLNLRGL